MEKFPINTQFILKDDCDGPGVIYTIKDYEDDSYLVMYYTDKLRSWWVPYDLFNRGISNEDIIILTR